VPTETDVEFGEIAVRNKIITRKQHDECMQLLKKLEKQLKREGKLKKKRPRLVDVLVQREFLTGSEARSVENARVYRQVRLDDKLYGRIALKSQFCSSDHIEAGLEKQKKLYLKGKKPLRLAKYLLDAEHITDEEDEAIQDAIEKLDAQEYVGRGRKRGGKKGADSDSDVDLDDDSDELSDLDDVSDDLASDDDVEELDEDDIELDLDADDADADADDDDDDDGIDLDDDDDDDDGIDLDSDDEDVPSLDDAEDVEELDSKIDVKLSGIDGLDLDLDDDSAPPASDVDHRKDTDTPKGLSDDDSGLDVDLDDDDDDDDGGIDLDDLDDDGGGGGGGDDDLGDISDLDLDDDDL